MAAEWNKLTVSQLKAELQQRGLENTGKKADLVSRLEQYEKEKPEQMNTDEQEIIKQIDEITKEGMDDNSKAEETMEQDEEANKTEDASKNGEAVESKENDANMEDEEKEVQNGEQEEMKADEEQKETDATEDTEAKEGQDNQGDSKEGEETEKREGEEEPKEGEENSKQEEERKEEFYDYTKNATGFILSLDNGRKIVIPNKDTLKADLLCCNQPKTVWVYPIKVDDITGGALNDFMSSCVHFHITFHENDNDKDKSEKGYAEFIFGSEEEAAEKVEKLSAEREDLTVRQLTLRDKRSEMLSDLPMEVLNEDLLLKRYLYIGNLPPTATSQALQELFPDAKRLAVITNEDGLPKGYALAEMPTEEAADRATKMYMNVEFEDCNLVVMRAWQRIPKGLLDHDTRVELLKTVKRDRLKLRGRNVDMNTRRKLESEMTLSKQRLDKDCKLREELGLPAPPDIVRREELMKEKKNEEGEGKDSEKKTTPKKFSRNTSAPYRKPQGGRGGGRSRGVPSLIRGGGRFGSRGGYGGSGYGGQDYYDNGGYAAAGVSGGAAGDGNYNQAVQMLMQVSKMLGTTGGQGGGSYRGGSGGYGGGNYSSGGYSGGYGSSGYGGYGGTRKRYAEDDGFGGVNKRGPGARNQRRW